MQVKADVATPTSGRSSTYNSGFKGPYSCPTCDNDLSSDSENKEGKPWPSSKYYDLYDYGATNQNYNRGKIGDGTKEFGPIYNISYNNGTTKKNVGSYNANEAFFVAYHVPWLMRGGNYNDGTNAGTAAFSSNFGQENGAFSFRIVLTP